MKFEDYYSILSEWYEDESKYENIIKIWNSKLCIYKLKDNSDYELRQILENLGINNDLDNFIDELRPLINNSKGTKSSNIKNYLEIQYKDFDSLIKVTKDYKKEVNKSKINDKNDIENVLFNLGGELAKFALPLIKNYLINNYPNLKDLTNLESGTIEKLKHNLFDLFTSENDSIFAKGINFNTVCHLFEQYKSGNLFNTITSECGKYFANKGVILTTLATSFLNLTTSIKEYYEYNLDTENTLEKFSNEANKIYESFENHKKLIKNINLENYEESMKLIEEIGKKISNDKQDLIILIKNIDEDHQKTEKENNNAKIKSIGYGTAFATCVLGTIFTGGAVAVAYGVAACGNGIAVAFNISKLKKIKERLKNCEKKIEEDKKKQEEIEESLNELKNKYLQGQQIFIPKNVI
jgi:hypothetical protein